MVRILSLAILVSALFAPAAKAQPPSPLAGQVNIAFKAKTSRETCALLAVEAMGVKEKFLNAEVMPDGNAFGWTENTAVMVVTTPYRDGVNVMVLAAGRDPTDAERLRNTVRAHIFEHDTAPDVAKQIKNGDPNQKAAAPTMRLGAEQRNLTPILRHFTAAASIVVEKHGLQPSDGGLKGAPVTFGLAPDRFVLTFLVPGLNEIGLQLISVGVAADGTEADRLQRTVRQDVLKVLFE